MSENGSQGRGPARADDAGERTPVFQAVDARLVRNTAEIAAELIRQAILEGRLQPGAPLREERLAAELGISRTPIREALLILQTEGVVEAIPKKGSFVRTYDLDEIVDLYETRAVLEGHAAARAAVRISEADLERLHESCVRYQGFVDEQDTTALVSENTLFHDLIIACADSPSVSRLLEIAACAPIMYRSSYWPMYGQTGVHYHWRIFRALSQRDATRAQVLMQEHILEAADLLIESLRAPAATGPS